MGVTGLLPFLRNVGVETHLGEFRGQTIGIDGYAWLHKSVVGCAKALALGEPTIKYVEFFETRIRLFRYYGVEPYFVFDGDHLPTKAYVEGDRRASRQTAKAKAMELMSQGLAQQANQQFQRSVDVTPTMASTVIELLKLYHVPYVVAPYEADAQLRYLELKGHINAILAEDSDLLIFGARRLLTKFESDGKCIEFARERFAQCNDPILGDLTDENLRTLAILSGCDYSPGVYGIGISRAYVLVRRYRDFHRILRALKLDAKSKVPDEFESIYTQANLTFQHQRVYCPESKCLVMLNPLTDPDSVKDVTEFHHFIGPDVEPEVSEAVALGTIDPMTKKRIFIPIKPTLRTDIYRPPLSRSIKSYYATPITPASKKPKLMTPQSQSKTLKPATPKMKASSVNAFSNIMGTLTSQQKSAGSMISGILSPLTPSQSNIQRRSSLYMNHGADKENVTHVSGYFGKRRKGDDKWRDELNELEGLGGFGREEYQPEEEIRSSPEKRETPSSGLENDLNKELPNDKNLGISKDTLLEDDSSQNGIKEKPDLPDTADSSSPVSSPLRHATDSYERPLTDIPPAVNASPTDTTSSDIQSSDIESPQKPGVSVTASLDSKLASFACKNTDFKPVRTKTIQKNIRFFLSKKS